MKKQFFIISIFFMAFIASLSVNAQHRSIIRRGCTPDVVGDEVATTRAGAPRKYASLPPKNRDWNPNRIYRQLVILVAFKGDSTYFSMENPRETYDRMFNESGFNIEKRNCKGCVADYFRDQSNGMFNMQFDVFGPYDVSLKAQPYESPNSSSRNYGKDAMVEATKMMIFENLNWDFSVYDWNGDGYVNQVIYVFAGYTGNAGEIGYGHLWPNTLYFSTTITTHDGLKIKNYTASAERWPSSSNLSCGIGTICHEFTHSLGLPDIYPTAGSDYSVVDEWDLMDGGNFTNYGWCPPNYSPHEKMLLGWLTPIELTDATTITGMKCVEDGGEVYMIKHTENEFYLLENRQWKGWDVGVPGKGLVVYHVNYDDSKWSSNSVNTKDGSPNYSLVHADNLDYNAWDDIVDTRDLSTYIESPRLHNRHLSSSPYPWTTDSTDFVNDCLTDSSTPASLMYNKNDADSKYLSKAIMNVRMSDDGLISFDFKGGQPTTAITLENNIQTYCSLDDMDFSGTDNIKAYIVSAFKPNTGEVTLTRITDVPANTGIVVKGAAGTYSIPVGPGETIVSNMLRGVTTNTVLNKVEGEYTNYILAKKNGNLGFYAVVDGSTLSAGKAYLPLPTASLPSGARSIKLVFEDDGTTGISEASPLNDNGEMINDNVYDLQGRRVEKPTRGLYIVNGRKVVIK